MKVGVVVLTTGERPGELAAALDSIRAQKGVNPRIVVVHNREAGAPDLTADTDVEVLRPERNVGIPAGRNLGVDALDDVDAVAFLDDDAVLLDTDVLVQAVAALTTDPRLAVVSLRLVDPDTGRTERRHVPRLVVGDPARSSWATTFLGGACVIRREAFEAAGRLPDVFFYAHEETSLAWRLFDQGWRIRYRGDLRVAHPAVPPSRHPDYHYLTARNRVLLARMHLPLVVGFVYVTVWASITLLRGGGRAAWQGFGHGRRMTGVERDPISWSTVWRMTRYGRPPIV